MSFQPPYLDLIHPRNGSRVPITILTTSVEVLKNNIIQSGIDPGFTLFINDKEIANDNDLITLRKFYGGKHVEGRLVYKKPEPIENNIFSDYVRSIVDDRSQKMFKEMKNNIMCAKNNLIPFLDKMKPIIDSIKIKNPQSRSQIPTHQLRATKKKDVKPPSPEKIVKKPQSSVKNEFDNVFNSAPQVNDDFNEDFNSGDNKQKEANPFYTSYNFESDEKKPEEKEPKKEEEPKEEEEPIKEPKKEEVPKKEVILSKKDERDIKQIKSTLKNQNFSDEDIALISNEDILKIKKENKAPAMQIMALKNLIKELKQKKEDDEFK